MARATPFRYYYFMSNATCQHCGHEVTWSQRPADAGYAAHVHEDNRVACPETSPAVTTA